MASLRPEEDRHHVIKLIEGNMKKIARPNIWKVERLHSTKKEGSESTLLPLHPFDSHTVVPRAVSNASRSGDLSPPRIGG